MKRLFVLAVIMFTIFQDIVFPIESNLAPKSRHAMDPDTAPILYKRLLSIDRAQWVAVIEEFAEREGKGVIPSIKYVLEKMEEELVGLKQQRLKYLIREAGLEDNYVGGFLDNKEYRKLAYELERLYRQIMSVVSILERIEGKMPTKGSSQESGFEPPLPTVERIRSILPEMTVSGDNCLDFKDIKWHDFEVVRTIVTEKEKTVEICGTQETTISVRKFLILSYRKTGQLFFFSAYDPKEVFCMICAQRFFHFLGLPTRHTYVLSDDKGNMGLLREFYAKGYRMDYYVKRFGGYPSFSPEWLKVLRGGLLLDEVIGYPDRDDSNLVVYFNRNGEPIPVFVDMKFSFGNPMMVRLRGEIQIDYGFSKNVVPFRKTEGGTACLPRGFAYNRYHSSASFEDMKWMAGLLRCVRRGHIETIVNYADELVRGHKFDKGRMIEEWWKSIQKAIGIYYPDETSLDEIEEAV